ncbi:MAG: single-stranded DNA-binding protein [Comamonadaceae bacterium CG12_big_fil_rev_8_21_14_0_65_59_15]|nr:MAG: single-stranded DNA-binding protein [Comamonadaceae bacterium CG12_big_fil_rev_8_21_14_0_65_59_15]
MASVNKVILLGNLGRDPEVRYMPSGDPIANVTIATSHRYKNKAGEPIEETEWHRVVFFGRLAEIVSQYLKKGNPVYVEGRIRTKKYTDKDGIERYSTEIIASEMQLLGSREGRGEPAPADDDSAYGRASTASRPAAPAYAPAVAPAPAPVSAQTPAARPGSGFDVMDDDIPF